MKKYSINKSTMIIMVILSIVCAISYFICCYWLNTQNVQVLSQQADVKNKALVETIRDVILVGLSISGTNLLLTALIEVKSKNAYWEEIVTNDIISAPNFYENMTDENRIKVYTALEKKLYFNYSIAHDMFAGIKNKLNNIIDTYYFESCDYVVSCHVSGSYIEKEITKSVSIKSYEKEITINDFSIGEFSSRSIEDVNVYKLISLKINGREIDQEAEITQQNIGMNNLGEQNKYNYNAKYIYNKPLKINDHEETQIVVKCKTKTPIDDKVSTFRVTKPCKKFSLIYNIREHDRYRLAVEAFGFLDDADDSANNSSDSNVNIRFNDWIFKYDGVVVSILDKCN